MKKSFLEYFNEQKFIFIPSIILCCIFGYFIFPNESRTIMYEDEVFCQITKINSGSSVRGAMRICDSLRIAYDLKITPSSKSDSLHIKKLKDVPFPYIFTKKKGVIQ